MEITIITPVYKEPKKLEKYLKRMSTQKFMDFNLVLIIDTDSEGILDVVSSFVKKIKNITIIHNTKRQGRANAILSSLPIIKSNYVYITSPSIGFNTNFTKNLNQLAVEKKTSIIEFGASIKNPSKYNISMRKKFIKPTNIKDDNSIIAFTQPFEFNKLFSTTLLKNVVLHKEEASNTSLSIWLIYKAFILADTYANSSQSLVVKTLGSSSSAPNPLKIIKEWNSILDFANVTNNTEMLPALEYAKYFFLVTITPMISAISQSSILNKKLKFSVQKIISKEFSNFFETNTYIYDKKSKEAPILEKNKSYVKYINNTKELMK